MSELKSAQLSVIIPTLNEQDNIVKLVDKVSSVLSQVNWEIIFVDDNSRDNTVPIIRKLAATNPQIRCIKRIGRKGLSSACIEGMLSSSAPFLAVMDADLQHDENLLLSMFQTLRDDSALDMVVGSRYVDGGGIGQWEKSRVKISRFATKLSRLLVPESLQDPMSGFFMLRRPVFENTVDKLSSGGFKILLDIFASSDKPIRFVELPYVFKERTEGQSKLSIKVVFDYGLLLFTKLLGKLLPSRFISFSVIGGLGVVIHFAVLSLLFKLLNIDFIISQSISVFVSMMFNYTINNITTYNDMQLTGAKWFKGLLSFVIVCSAGAVANIALSTFLFDKLGFVWPIAVMIGIIFGAVWNFVMTRFYTWN